MKEILTSPAFWSGVTPIVLAVLSILTRRPKAVLDYLARRQLFDGPKNNVKGKKAK